VQKGDFLAGILWLVLCWLSGSSLAARVRFVMACWANSRNLRGNAYFSIDLSWAFLLRWVRLNVRVIYERQGLLCGSGGLHRMLRNRPKNPLCRILCTVHPPAAPVSSLTLV